MKKIIVILSVVALLTSCDIGYSNGTIVIKHLDGTLEQVTGRCTPINSYSKIMEVHISDGRLIYTSIDNIEVIEEVHEMNK